MDEKGFWEVIDLADWSREGDDEVVTEGMVRRLASLPDEEIFAFDDALAEHLHALDRRDIAEAVFGGEEYFSPDEFLDWRCVCVVNGEGLYRDVLAARRFPSPDLYFESLLYVPMRAWARKHGTDAESYPHQSEPDYFTYGNVEGWPSAAGAVVAAADDGGDSADEEQAAFEARVKSLDWDDFLRLALVQGERGSFSHIEPKDAQMVFAMQGERVYSYLTLLLGPVYWAYRRCYLPALALLAIYVGLLAGFLLVGVNPRMFRFLPGAIAGAYFYRIYRWQTNAAMHKMSAAGIDDPAAQEAYMRERGGTSVAAAVGMAVLYLGASVAALAPLWLPALGAGAF